MSAYAIFQIKITNKENYTKYVNSVSPIVKKFQGEYLVRGGKSEVVLGKWEFPRTVIVKFPTFDIAMNWYNSDDYKPIKKLREDNSEANCLIVEGV